jgi:hypothetical protein
MRNPGHAARTCTRPCTPRSGPLPFLAAAPLIAAAAVALSLIAARIPVRRDLT